MGKTVIKNQKKKKTPEVKTVDSGESSQTDSRAGSPDHSECLEDIQNSIFELREMGKENPEIDYLKELRKIQDYISDLKGDDRRPITGLKPAIKKSPAQKKEEKDDSSSSDDEDSDAKMKELINKRLTTCMMLALSFEPDTSYPKDFYEKLNDSKKFKEISQPFNKEEMKLMNQLIKDRKKIAKKRIEECGGELK